MSQRARLATFGVIVFVVITTMTAYAVAAASNYRDARGKEPSVPTVPDTEVETKLVTGPRILFRHTGPDKDLGHVAVVPLADPAGARAFTDVECDRVDATAEVAACLHTERGVVTKFSLTEYDPDWHEIQKVSVPGIPSRTRLSPDGSLVSSTTFVSGHTYMQVGFSTVTEIRDVGGDNHGNLEKFDLVIHGDHVSPRDRNIWGVTFTDDDNTFYATVGTGGETYLVEGDLAARTLTSVADHVECPSLSPDGTQIAFKQATERDGQTWWTPAVLDLATGARTVLAGEEHNVDDQLAWLDDHTLLYGLPRTDEAGVTDVWAIDTDADARPRLFIQQAWSPAVVRP